MAGFAPTAILLTVIQTCREQGRSAIEFFQQALTAKGAQGHLDLPLVADTDVLQIIARMATTGLT